jgi:membrane protein
MTDSRLSSKEQVQTLWKLGGLTPGQLARRVWHEVNQDDVLGRASELAYSWLFALFPLLLVLTVMLGMLAAQGSEMQKVLMSSLSRVVPGEASTLVSSIMNEISQGSGGGKLTFGLVLALWTASSGTSVMIYVCDVAYGVRDSRSFLKVRGLAMLLTLALGVLVISALTIFVFGGRIAEWVGGFAGFSNALLLLWKIAQWPVAVFFVSLAFALVYYFGPDVKEQHWYWITPGSLIGVLLWVAASFGFRIYLHYFGNFNATYGSLGAAIVLLTWLYVTGLTFLLGAEINAEIEHAAARRGHPEAKAEGEKAA